MAEPASSPTSPEALIPKFEYSRLLKQDQAGRRIVLVGSIASQPALLIAERAAFPGNATSDSADRDALSSLATTLRTLKNLGANDIYAWFLASSGTSQPPDLKLNLIYPCTESHIKKYSPQRVRLVTETPEIYAQHVRGHMQRLREAGRLNWVFNIIEGRTEQEDVVYREYSAQGGDGGDEGFLLLPDLNWDRKTLSGLHLLGIVERRDIWSLRDLQRAHVPWLKHMRQKLIDTTVRLYPDIEEDELKLYVHYQPTYYHFHIHVVHASLEAGATQAVGKAFGLENLISQLEGMTDGKGLADVSLTYTVGEASELWTEIFLPLKNRTTKVG